MLSSHPEENVYGQNSVIKRSGQEISAKGFVLFLCVSFTDDSLNKRRQLCLSFKKWNAVLLLRTPQNVYTVLCGCFTLCLWFPKNAHLFLAVQKGVGKSFPWSQLLAYQPCNKDSLWVAAGGGPSRVCSCGLCLSSPWQVSCAFCLNSPPPSSRMETEAMDMWGTWNF